MAMRTWIVVSPTYNEDGSATLRAELRTEYGDTPPGYGWDDEAVVLSKEIPLPTLRAAVREHQRAAAYEARQRAERKRHAEEARIRDEEIRRALEAEGFVTLSVRRPRRPYVAKHW